MLLLLLVVVRSSSEDLTLRSCSGSSHSLLLSVHVLGVEATDDLSLDLRRGRSSLERCEGGGGDDRELLLR